jgi:hypothetical protein
VDKEGGRKPPSFIWASATSANRFVSTIPEMQHSENHGKSPSGKGRIVVISHVVSGLLLAIMPVVELQYSGSRSQ